MVGNVRETHIESQMLCAPEDGGARLPDNPASRLHVHLRAWRRFRKLSLKEVAQHFQKTHTTVSRWEQGEIPLTLPDLERLSALYRATPSQLANPPENAELVARLDRTQHIVETMDENTLEHWLSIGETLAKR